MYIKEIPFAITISRRQSSSRTKAAIDTSIKQIIQAKPRRAFIVKHIHGEGQFEHIKKAKSDTDINFNITGTNKQMLAIVEEWVWEIAIQLSFQIYPNRIIVKMVYNVIIWPSCFPHKKELLTS